MKHLLRSVARAGALLLLATPGSAAARPVLQDPDTLHAQAVEAYREGDLASATALWSELLEGADLGPEARARVLYDLGNAAYRDGRPLVAVARYLGALRELPRDADLWHNLELARREAGLEPQDRGDLAATAARLAGALDDRELATVTWWSLALLGLALGWEAWRGGRAARWSAGSVAVVALGFLALGLSRELAAPADPLVVVAPGTTDLRSEPRGDLVVIGRVEAGAVVERLDTLAGWVRIEAGDLRGWLREEAVLDLDG